MAFRRGHRSDRIPARRREDLRNAVNPFHADIVGSRTWPRLHLVVDLTTAEILSSKITTHCTRDSTAVPDLLAPITRGLASVRADGAYDRSSVYCAIENHLSDDPTPNRILIPPGRNEKTSDDLGVDSAQRNVNIKHIARHGRRHWQKASGYTLRNLAAVWSRPLCRASRMNSAAPLETELFKHRKRGPALLVQF